ncbi:hypothetical protein [Bradyrhizobium sp. USDA 10063]
MADNSFRRTLALGIVAAVLPAGPQAASAASPCRGVDTQLTKQRKSEYAKLVAQSLTAKVNPSDISVLKFMKAGTWTVVYADVPIADPGFFFFDASSGAPKFKTVWGGAAEVGEGPKIAKWARELGANTEIASCFADATFNQ